MPSKKELIKKTEIRWAIVDHVHQEVYTQNHRDIGEAFNSISEDYVNNKNLIVVATRDDQILGEVNRRGGFINIHRKLPETIWSGSPHVYFDPKIANSLVVQNAF